MNRKLRTIAVAVALATILVAQLFEELLRPTGERIYHWSGATSALFAPPLIVFIVVSGLLAALLMSAERPGYWRAFVWTGVILFLPWLLIHKLQNIWPDYVPGWVRLPPYVVLLVLWPIVAIAAYRFARRQSEAVIDTVSVILAFTALSTVLFVVQLLWFWWLGRDLNRPLPMHAASTTARIQAKPRIIWIVLDELSYDQVYGHRFPGLQLPAFDALARDATVFTDVEPTSDRTEKALPALLSGHTVTEVASTRAGMLLVRSSPKAKWERLDERDTVFNDALRSGYKTAVVGWYNPYCRIFHDVLDSCYWSSEDSLRSFRANLLVSADRVMSARSLRRVLTRSFHVPEHLADTEDEAHLQDYLNMENPTRDVLLDRSKTFTFLHLPIPHPNGIFSRSTGKLTTGGTYLDNLALADQWLGQTRALLESTGQWDSATVIIMGDHSWRTKTIWEKLPNWTAEEQRASLGGKFDTRPGYIVKLAGQQSGQTIDEPFEAVRTRALVDELMAGKIRSPEDLKNWVDEGRDANQKYALDAHQ